VIGNPTVIYSRSWFTLARKFGAACVAASEIYSGQRKNSVTVEPDSRSGHLELYILSIMRIVTALMFFEHGLSRLFGFRVGQAAAVTIEFKTNVRLRGSIACWRFARWYLVMRNWNLEFQGAVHG